MEEVDPEAFSALAQRILDILDRASDRQGHPVEADGPRFVWPPRGLMMERRVGDKGLVLILAEQAFAWCLQLFGLRAGGFDISLYRADVARNNDFRKFDDGLKLTADCPAAIIDEIEAVLSDAAMSNIAQYGLHRQDSALMTCILPAPTARDHMHFVDGASGGYARAAERLKKSLNG